MKQVVARATAAIIFGAACAPLGAAAEPDKAAMQKVTAECKAQVKEYARYHETAWYQRHKMVKNCIKQALAKR